MIVLEADAALWIPTMIEKKRTDTIVAVMNVFLFIGNHLTNDLIRLRELLSWFVNPVLVKVSWQGAQTRCTMCNVA